MAQLRDLFTTRELKTVPKALGAVRETLVAALAGDLRLRGDGQKPRVVLVVGVNGSGKTTTAAKLAKRLKDSGERPLLAAADTFRAAAIEQLERWAERVGVPIISGKPDGDPAAVVFDAVSAAGAVLAVLWGMTNPAGPASRMRAAGDRSARYCPCSRRPSPRRVRRCARRRTARGS